MEASVGVNLRVTTHSDQGQREHMEDMCSIFQPKTNEEQESPFAYFGIFDGHGGSEAAVHAKDHLMDHIVSQKNFWSDDDELVLRAIRDGFIREHRSMWSKLDEWPKARHNLPSTSGTTASIMFVRRGKLFIGHAGDSRIVLGYQHARSTSRFSHPWKAEPLTIDHKPDNPVEHARIKDSGGKVLYVPGRGSRVVWHRPKIGHKGPSRRSTVIQEIPFLAIARSLGDFWSYDAYHDQFVVSPIPDVCVINLDPNKHRCVILGTDGLWNMLSDECAVDAICSTDWENYLRNQNTPDDVNSSSNTTFTNPSKQLVTLALQKWRNQYLRADNISVITVIIDPPSSSDPCTAQKLPTTPELVPGNNVTSPDIKASNWPK